MQIAKTYNVTISSDEDITLLKQDLAEKISLATVSKEGDLCEVITLGEYTTNITQLHKLLKKLHIWPSSYSDFRAKWLALEGNTKRFVVEIALSDDELISATLIIVEAIKHKVAK